jgi:hypothetical protein
LEVWGLEKQVSFELKEGLIKRLAEGDYLESNKSSLQMDFVNFFNNFKKTKPCEFNDLKIKVQLVKIF